MTREELKRLLYSYRDLKREQKQVAGMLAKIENKMTSPRGTGSDGMPHGSGSGDPMLDIVSQHIKLENRYKQLNARLLQSQNQIEDMIDRLGPKERVLMRYYYIEGLTMEEAGNRMGYVERQAHRIHSGALMHLLEKMS